MVPWDCLDAYPDPDDPDAPTTTSTGGGSGGPASNGMSTATVATIVIVVLAGVTILVFLFVKYRASRASQMVLSSGVDGHMHLMRDTDSNSASDVYESHSHSLQHSSISSLPGNTQTLTQPTGLDYYMAPPTQTQPKVGGLTVEMPEM